ncbi:MAG TPA: ABC transporter permease [Vicinamibacterales bacterium]|nr:ABC transporter permease [Vicinamibacterales bacterium]
MRRLGTDLSYAVRTFAKTPGFTAIAVVVLAIGIGANTAIFTFVNELLLRPLPGRASELVGVYSRDRVVPDSYRPFSYPNYVDVRDGSDLFDALMAHTFTMVGTPAGEGTKRTLAAVVSSNYFDTLGVTLAAGRPFSGDEERPGSRIPVAIVTHTRWTQEKRDPAFIGKTIRINAIDFTVIGVTPEGFSGTMALVSAELYLPLGMFDTVVTDRFKNNGNGLTDRSNASLVVAGRVKAGVTTPVVSARLDALSRQLEAAYPADNKNLALTANPLPRMSASPAPQDNSAITAFTALLLGLSGIVLVIACLNIANMLLARGATRRKEIALRIALGARRGRVVRQLLTESVLLAIAGAALGLMLSVWATRVLAASMVGALPFTVTFRATPDVSVLLATIAFTAVSTIAFGLGPALRLSRRDLVVDLKDRTGDGARAGRWFSGRNLMVVGQVALSLSMLTAGGIFTRTALDARSGNPGFAYDRMLIARLEGMLAGFNDTRGRLVFDAVLDRLRSMPGVEAATLASSMPFSDSVEGARFESLGETNREPVRARAHRVIGADYFSALGLRMIGGREFTRAEETSGSAPRVAIVDEALAAALFGGQNPIGQLIRLAPEVDDAGAVRGEPMEVVGIAPPLREELLDRGPVPHVYVPFGRNYRARMFAIIRTSTGGNELTQLEGVRKTIRAVEPDLPVVSLSTMAAFHSGSLELWALNAGAGLFTMLGLLALLLAVVGVYGVKSYVVAQRTREIGIRMALGASPRDVLSLMLRDGFRLTGLGVAIGVPLATLVSVAFTKVFVEVGGFDATVIAVATVVLAAAATIAGGVPARRATRVQPITALQRD